MTPHTVHRIAQEVRQLHAVLTLEETWAQHQPKTVTRDEIFRRITFWRYMLRLTNLILGEYEQWRNDADGQDQRRRFWSNVAKVAEHQLATTNTGNSGLSTSTRLPAAAGSRHAHTRGA